MKKIVSIVMIICLSFVLYGCGGNDAAKTATPQLTEEKVTAVETTLGAGNFYVGEDIEPGRYVITSTKEGKIAVYNKGKDYAEVRERLNGTNGVESVTYDLIDGQKIEITQMDEVLFTPYE